jgi:hypothetical protein
MKRERREQERRKERARIEKERHIKESGARGEEERREREAAQSNLVTRLRVYEENWATLRGNDVRAENLGFYGIPRPSNVLGVEDIKERVLAFV